jgi:hypothetical protein
MKHLGMTTKLASLLAILVCAFAVSAAAASAATIEPLNTAFSSNSTEGSRWVASDATWNCNKTSISGTTNATKTNYINVTPSFSECGGTTPIVYGSSCEKGVTSQWTLTFNEGTHAGSLRLNCSLTVAIHGICVMTAPPQTVEKAFIWNNEGTKNLGIRFQNTPLVFKSPTPPCEAAGLTATKRTFSANFLIGGVQVH